MKSYTIPLTIMCTPTQWQALRTAAEACGKPLSTFIRETALGNRPQPSPGRADAALIRELGRSAMALTGLAATARASGALPPAALLEAALAELLDLLRRLLPIGRIPLECPNAQRPDTVPEL